jgi:hypothetical protein
MSTHRTISEDQFEAEFLPVLDEEGSYRQFDWTVAADVGEIERARVENRLWTAVDDDYGDFAIVQGYARVNRIYYIVAAVAYDADDRIEVECDTPTRCDRCGDLDDDSAHQRTDGRCAGCVDQTDEEIGL